MLSGPAGAEGRGGEDIFSLIVLEGSGGPLRGSWWTSEIWAGTLPLGLRPI